MKTFNNFLVMTLASSALFLVGCTNDDSEVITSGTTETLQVADGFNFETVENTKIKITAPDLDGNPITNAVVQIYTDSPVDGGKLLSQGKTNSQGIYEVTLSLPTYFESIHVIANHFEIYEKSVDVAIVGGEANHTYSSPTEPPSETPGDRNAAPSGGNGGVAEISKATFGKTSNGIAGTDTTTLFYDDFESGIGSWTTAIYPSLNNWNASNLPADDLWHIVQTTGIDGNQTNAFWCGDDAKGTYNTGRQINTAVITPMISLPADTGIVLTFDEKYNTENSWDYCMVDVRPDTGTTWFKLRGYPLQYKNKIIGTAGTTPFGLYGGEVLLSESNANTISGAAPSGKSGGWISTELSLDDFAGQNIQIRFYFDTVDWIIQNYSGWFVDNVHIIEPDADTDGDGVSDKVDDFPNDPTRAFTSYYPDKVSFGTIVFEDRWPNQGDYDFNDLVMDFQYKFVLNSNNELIDVEAKYVAKAIGASLKNGFGVSLPIPQASVSNFARSNAFSENIVTVGSNGLESGHPSGQTVVIVYDNVSNYLQPVGTETFVNTESGGTYVSPDTASFSFTLSTPMTPQEFSVVEPPFNPFIFVNKVRGHEIHLPDKPPTALADLTLLGTADDASSTTNGTYYKTANDLPWAIQLPTSFGYPKEKVDILNAYYNFDDWAQSGGNTNTDWYLPIVGNVDLLNIFQIPNLTKE